MAGTKQTICLCSIVKNESHVIRRMLESVADKIDYWVISDTGSTDDTADIIREFFAERGIPGELHHDEWRDFGHNRTLNFAHARHKADWLLTLDADGTLDGDLEDFPPPDCEVVAIRRRLGKVQFFVSALFKGDLEWTWKDAIHEYVDVDHVRTQYFPGLIDLSFHDGARCSDPAKYEKDAELLETLVAANPEHARYRFYCAQSWRDAGMWALVRGDADKARECFEKAVPHYVARSEMGGNEEEVWWCQFQWAVCQERLGNHCLEAYLSAFNARPYRAEPLLEAARYCRESQAFPLALLFAQSANRVPYPNHDIMFVDMWCYRWRCKEEMAAALFGLGRHEEANAIIRMILEYDLPDEIRAKLLDNIKLIEETKQAA